ncbi:MAG: tRNA lysidine(34) synthetase TilS [Flavobacteriaceae bacterium]|nr:tRNA lysidine(34) synthetase TilS [Flavobacteriaceae bacterium]
MKLFRRVQAHIDINFPFLAHAKLLIAISGGVDSMVAASLFQKLEFNVGLAHCNFKLRGQEADLDAQFVKDWANKNKIPYFITRFETKEYANIHKISIQMAARNLRYEWFKEILQKKSYDYIITAHHANDNIETTLLNLTRGTGLKGLLGIPSKNDKIVRPLLPFSRDEILNYAQKNNIAWREDKSNASVKYIRNKIRHQVIPVLQELNPNLIESYNKTLGHLNDLQYILNERLDTVKKELLSELPNGVISLDITKALALSNHKVYLFELLRDYGFTAWNDIENLLYSQSGKQIFSKTHRLLKDRQVCLISPLEDASEHAFEIKNINEGLQNSKLSLTFEEVSQADFNNANRSVIFVDADKIKTSLVVRKWQKGDYFYPLGMQGKKKLSDFYKDQKMSLLDKEDTWLFCANKDIIWIIGQRLDNRFKVTEDTKKIIKIIHQ